jgi:2'-5' RNA ligase
MDSTNRTARRAGLLCLGIILFAAACRRDAPKPAEEPAGAIAIDVLLDPDETMVRRAKAANDRLRAVHPAGFALDASHHPHVTLLQRYVKASELARVYESIEKVLADEKPTTWKLEAFKYYYVVWEGLGLAAIAIEPTDDLVRLQKKIVDAVAPFTVTAGGSSAFVTSKEAPDINESTIDYVRTFVPDASGAKFNPHVTIGQAPEEHLKPILAEPFERFTFRPTSVSVYQLGNFGTAQKKLKSW